MIKNDLETILKKVKLLELENEMLKSQNEELLKFLIDMQEKLKNTKQNQKNGQAMLEMLVEL